MNDFRKRLNNKGFTLVELLVVIAIIAILSVTAFITLGGETVKARDSRRMQDLSTIQSAMEIIFINEDGYPATLTAPPIDKKYLSPIPTDPKGSAYDYYVSGSTYLVGATLENDGVPANYTAYVVGNAASFPADTGILGSTCGAANTICNVDPVATPNCIPYCP